MFRSLLKYCFLAAFLLIIQSAFAQKYGNEWITPGQRYFKIPVSKTGFYLLTFNDLANAGFPLSSTDSRKIQLFHRGKEQSIYLSGEADGHFDPSDSLVFYGIRNNGELDSLLYVPYTSQPHKYYNIYSDTTAYFLTVSSTENGRRMAQLNNPSGGAPESYHLQEILNVYADEYEHGLIYSIETVRSSWDIGEGWTGVVYDNVNKEIGNYQFDLSNYVSSGPLPKLEILFCGRNDLGHVIKVTVGDPLSGTVYTVNNFSGRSVKYFSADVNPSLISGNQLKVAIQVTGSGQSDAASVSYMKLTYPQQLNMGGRAEANLNLLANASSISVSGIFSIPATPVIYDITNRNEVKIIKSNIAAGSLVAGINNISSSRLFVTSAASYNKPSNISEVDLNTYPVSAKYVIITHPSLMNSVNEYAAYRQSADGGGYTTLITDIQKLYNLFSYGEKSSSAVRKFFNYYVDKGNPEYAIIIGKGLEPGHVSDGQNYRQHPEATWNASISQERADDLVPVGGTPGSDWVYVMGLGGKGKYVPAIPLGRIPARNNDQVRAYLEKVKEHEDPSRNPNALWRKRLVHLSGGNSQNQIQTFKNYLLGFKAIAEGQFLGGRVKSFVKNTTSPTEFINLSADVNEGVSLITFFGHSSPQYSDVDIGIVSGNIYGYNNKGKYPMILMNGCASSNIYTGFSFAEDWILTGNKGAILFVGHTDAGYPLELKPYSEQIYRKMFTDTLGMHRPFGQIQRDAIEAYMGGAFGEPAFANAEQMILVGDPALRVYAPGFKEHGKSTNDYAINSSGIFLKSFDSDRVSAISDSFAIGIPISNLGITNKNKFSVCLKRTIGTKIINYSPVYFDPIYFEDTIYYTVRSKDPETYGLNNFEIILDCENAIVEVDDYTNNKVSLDFFMPLSSVACLYPSEFSIVNKQPVTFIAQTTDLLEAEADYLIELDTSWKFNSSFKKSVTIHSGSLIKWENVALLDTLPSNDSTVYYWRVRKSGNEENELWAYSSFIYIHNSPEGWSQSRFPQFFKDEAVDASIDSLTGTLRFSENNTHIYIHTTGPKFYPPVNTEYLELSDKQFTQTIVRTNGVPWVYNGRGACQTHPDIGSMFGLSFNRISGKLYVATPDVPLCGVAGRVVSNLINENYYSTYISQVKHGDYILLMSHGRVDFNSWSEDTKKLFKNNLKAKLIDSLKSDYAYIILTKKGLDKPIYEKYSDTQIDLDTVLSGLNYKGGITSTLIGPSNEWGSLFHTVKTSQNDQYELKIIRYNLKNVADTILIPQKDSLDLGAIINSDAYPYIKLYAELMDSVNLTPPDLNKWQVIYSPVPEGTITPVAWKLEKSRTVEKQEGEPYSLNFEFTNITNRPFTDSLKVKYTLKNGSGKVDTSLVNIGKLGPLGTVQFSHEIKSTGFSGKNYFQTYVNPRLQKEQYYNNNFLELEVNVIGDKTNPLLDVLFDGVHIMDGDLVSPSPVINVMINDENKYLLKTDSVGISVFLQRPGKNPEQIYFTNPDIIKWGQTSNTKSNSFSIEYNPKNLPDGTYKLIVQGADASNNKSGINFYEITFTVENASTISHFYPYPNPFSTSTQFVFTLSGSVIPEDLKIQIMTVTGKIVREITKAELGTIRIGNNRSDYAWDGRDEFGDKLANGVYLYRVIIKNAGDNFKQRSTAGDKAFKKDFGKLYILR